ncbi:uncharacterized protein PV07_03763 [Cladophialophora immunda]|uniref:Transcription factor domain-containing protein n=1 Tax=Cladophialophora immunda TaxID=569365 RepID=A0A0D2CLU7_9EURO|nr:uncharacterized protein PV07_03763 [Cladophialophora immunda]KIW32203.1 hypothetical protein PV07_03763 [Cladophialophora immunda]
MEIWYQQVSFLAHVIFSCSGSFEYLDYAQKSKGLFVISQEQRLRNLDGASVKQDVATWMQSQEDLDAWRRIESIKRTAFAASSRIVGSSYIGRLEQRARQTRYNYIAPGVKAGTEQDADLDPNPPSLDTWVEILYRDGTAPGTLGGFSRLLVMLAISQDIREYIRAAEKFRCLQNKEHPHSRSEWTDLLSKCYERLIRTPCSEKTWPLHQELISQSYHCTMISLHVTVTDLYTFVGYKANYQEADVTRHRLSTWMLEQPQSIQVALLHAIQIFVQMRTKSPKSPHASLVLCLAVLTIWVYVELKIGPRGMELGRCLECRRDLLGSLDHCCLKATIGHEISGFELDLIEGAVPVDRLVREGCDLLNTKPAWQLSHAVASTITYCYQSITRSRRAACNPP